MQNHITSKYTDYLCIHHLFEEQVANNPEATALVFEEEELSYGELNARANLLAHRLIDLGVGPDQQVAICVQRSPAMVVGLMAILKAGGAYVPLDPDYPGERLAYILGDTAPVLVLADAAGRQVLGEVLQTHTVLDPNEFQARGVAEADADANPRVPGLTPSNLAYIIYTSGSTGQPKGVMIEHAQVVRLFDTTQPSFGFEASDVWCLFHSFAFDFSVWELWGALRYGGRLVLVPHAITRSPQAFYQLVCEQGVTVLNLTPSAFKALMEYVQPSSDRLRYVIFGGEALQPSTLRDWYAVRGESVPQLVNMYGITETTVHVTYYPLTSSDAQQADSVIGKRLPDLNLYLLDAHGQPVPMGSVGEMYVGGAGVARGYAIAHALMCKDASVEFLGFIDVPAPHKLLYKNQDIKHYFIEHVKAVASEAESHEFDILSECDEFGELIRKAQDLGGYDLNADISLETVKWQTIYQFSQIAGAYKPLPLPINLYHFYAADRERASLPQVDMVGGWRERLPDLAIRSISIPGGHVSMMADVSNRKHLAEALNRALLQG